MGDKKLPIQVTNIALNNQEDNEGYPQQEQGIGVDKLQIMQFVHTTQGTLKHSHRNHVTANMGSHGIF